jgi:hypothetical protein
MTVVGTLVVTVVVVGHVGHVRYMITTRLVLG